ncbi:probable LRR receptor-like serine/threonine-protein kinase At1g07650 isoform X1 [Ricinus communis]|uniref:probable LRR receptor-like serine/threonine-protein kinase At1g07650 isoform X1 n=1 Tax=Ricinus communis TaxID=3988 RepID=UPI00201AF219|nr:probable LRR receptor-like serine/threonine-protein kinase At1g07650 isoform X1 [Ricinus communis]
MQELISMVKHIRCLLSWYTTNICIFILMITLRVPVSQPLEVTCTLDLSFSLPDYYVSNCIEGGWGGFLSKNCCGSTFHAYLHSLGRRANRTGFIYLDSDEQRSCLDEMGKYEAEDFSCGIDKLTSGGGGCSDFSVANVTRRLGGKLKRLTENCKFEDSDKESDQSCRSCVSSWQDIKGHHSSSNANICRFAVLVALTSTRIDDNSYINRVYRCLANQNNDTESAETAVKSKPKISTGIWILIGCLFAATAMIITIAANIVSRRRLKSKVPLEKNAFKNLQLENSRCPKFPLREVYLATNNLSDENLIGEGTAGKVYKGVLSNSQHVAIKHIINDGNRETVVREVTSLSHVRHPNLVALLGCCIREDECFILYELCPNGNLSQWIFGKDKILSWIQRLQIAIDSARALCFLHTYSEGCIVHRDIKPTNILLGQNFEAKLSDFGLSKVISQGETYASSEVRGTFGYVDPEYQSNRQVNSSGDVYSFGIVLLQILSGKKVINMNLKKPMPIDKMAKALTRGGSIIEFADPKLDGEYSAEAFVLIFKLALSCTALKQLRPSMEQVVIKLEEALVVSTRARASTPETTPNRFSIPQ